MGKLQILTGLLVLLTALATANAGQVLLEGERQQGSLLFGYTQPGTKVTFRGKPVRVSDDGRFLIGFGRDDPLEARLDLEFIDGTTHTERIRIRKREYEVQRIDGLPPTMVTPDEAALMRIREENRMIGRARSRDTAATYFASGFEWPATGIISGVYGSQRILNGQPRQPHFGLDIAAPTGTPVRAPASGIVSLVHPDMYFTGGTVIIDHGHGLSSAFLHLSRILVKQGDFVDKGQVFAEIGATGRVTGAHLDWRINLFNTRIDPALLVGPMPDTSASVQPTAH
jgi:murein DD-endopeptidase MepM/ murein hydrolase activator NlpD